MIVVSDTTSLRYLVFLGEDRLLHAIFGTVYVPPEVVAELRRSKSPELEPVRRWAATPPAWLRVEGPKTVDESLRQRLDRGEAEAIALARQLNAERLLLDERRARTVAKEMAEADRKANRPAWQVAGTLAVLEEGAVRNLVDIDEVTDRLRNTNYRAKEVLYQQTIENVRRRKLAQEQDRAQQEQLAKEQGAPTPEHKQEQKRGQGFGRGR